MTDRLNISPGAATVIAFAPPRTQARPARHRFSMRATVGAFVLVTNVLFCAPANAQGDAVAGKTGFANQCASCHTTEAGKNGFGPSLAGVFGRHSGAAPGYQYTDAMSNSGL